MKYTHARPQSKTRSFTLDPCKKFWYNFNKDKRKELKMDDLINTDLLPDDDNDESAPEQDDEAIEEKLATEEIPTTIKLDYKLKTKEERN
jgi:hypothetical protein